MDARSEEIAEVRAHLVEARRCAVGDPDAKLAWTTWSTLVDARVERPERLSHAQFADLTAEERAAYNDARIRYSQAGAFISTPQLREVKRAVHERMLINTHRTVGKLGVILSGEPGQGKTTTLMQIGKEHELRRRTTGHLAGAPGKIPVVYVAVPAQCTAKELLHEFTRFLALPSPKGATYGRLVELVAQPCASAARSSSS